MACKLRSRWSLIAALFLETALPAAARDYIIAAPDTASLGAEVDWRSITAALNSGQLAGGDRLLLEAGDYGALQITGQTFDPPLTIASVPGGRAHLDRIQVKNSSGITVSDLNVWPLTARQKGVAVQTDARSSQIRFERLDIRSGPEALNYLDWTAEDWLTTWRFGGVQLKGPDMALIDSSLTGVSNAISSSGARGQVIGNEVHGFSKDGMRGFGTGTLFQGNTVRDCVKVDGNHDDGFQSWAAHGDAPSEITAITLDGNTIIEWTGPPGHPLRCRLQGISLFNGPYRDWVIQNNLVVIRSPHGITIFDGINMRVLNNTVVNIDGNSNKAPWIMQKRKKTTGQAPNIFANNLATALKLGKNARNNRNLAVRNTYMDFENPAEFDFRPRAGGRLIDTADPAFAPSHDLTGTARSVGAGPDMGAYERR